MKGIVKQPFIYSLKNYKFIFQPSNDNGGGTGFFINSKSNYRVLKEIRNKVEIILDCRKKFIIGSVYRHPKYSFEDFKESFTYLENYSTVYTN